jgi:hypothetical protein
MEEVEQRMEQLPRGDIIFIERPSAAINGYLRFPHRGRVPFLCLCKEKEPKESTPRSRRNPPALLAKGGLARRHIPVPLARSRSQREPR